MSIRLFWRRGLLALAGAGAIAAAAPAVASAATVSGLTISPSSVPAAPPAPNVTVGYTFSGGSPTSLSTHLPSGLLANGAINGGACLVTPASNTPPAGCQVGTGLANGVLPLTLYLVQGPTAGDLAGLEIVAGGLNSGVGDVRARSSDGGLDIAFATLPPALSSLSTTFTGADIRMPTHCPGENITAGADGQSTPTAAAPALTVTGCSGLSYNPNLSATVKKDAGDTGAEVISTITQANASSESATKAGTLGFGSTLVPNTGAIAACFVSPCQIGTATVTTPLLPSSVTGTVTLGGSLLAPTLTINFPALNLSLVGAVNLTAGSVTFSNEPDFPISMLTVDVTGPSAGGKAFITTCTPGTLTGAFTPWDGNATVNKTAQIQYQGCPAGSAAGKPTASGSLSGLANRHPKLKFRVKHGSNAPNISSVSVKPASGLRFKCVKSGKSCKGLSVTGGTLKSAKVSGGQLVIKLKKPAASVTVKAKGPAISESRALQTKVKAHKVKSITFTLKVKDSSGKATTIKLKLKA